MTQNIKCPHCGKTIDLSGVMSELGKKGAETNKKKGSEYFSDLAKKGWVKRKQTKIDKIKE